MLKQAAEVVRARVPCVFCLLTRFDIVYGLSAFIRFVLFAGLIGMRTRQFMTLFSIDITHGNIAYFISHLKIQIGWCNFAFVCGHSYVTTYIVAALTNHLTRYLSNLSIRWLTMASSMLMEYMNQRQMPSNISFESDVFTDQEWAIGQTISRDCGKLVIVYICSESVPCWQNYARDIVSRISESVCNKSTAPISFVLFINIFNQFFVSEVSFEDVILWLCASVFNVTHRNSFSDSWAVIDSWWGWCRPYLK